MLHATLLCVPAAQRSAHELPMVEKQDMDSCSVLGGQQMILTGQNFSSDSKVIFMEKTQGKRHSNNTLCFQTKSVTEFIKSLWCLSICQFHCRTTLCHSHNTTRTTTNESQLAVSVHEVIAVTCLRFHLIDESAWIICMIWRITLLPDFLLTFSPSPSCLISHTGLSLFDQWCHIKVCFICWNKWTEQKDLFLAARTCSNLSCLLTFLRQTEAFVLWLGAFMVLVLGQRSEVLLLWVSLILIKWHQCCIFKSTGYLK